jgi:hypothetical protein
VKGGNGSGKSECGRRKGEKTEVEKMRSWEGEKTEGEK